MTVSSTDPGAELLGRLAERAALDRLLERARAGRSAVLVVRGEPGIGKTALLDYAASRASGFRVVRAGGVESEMELPYAGLHQLCLPLLDRLETRACRKRLRPHAPPLPGHSRHVRSTCSSTVSRRDTPMATLPG
jgi:AAA ATPase domain